MTRVAHDKGGGVNHQIHRIKKSYTCDVTLFYFSGMDGTRTISI
jgi:hypothetical protein